MNKNVSIKQGNYAPNSNFEGGLISALKEKFGLVLIPAAIQHLKRIFENYKESIDASGQSILVFLKRMECILLKREASIQAYVWIVWVKLNMSSVSAAAQRLTLGNSTCGVLLSAKRQHTNNIKTRPLLYTGSHYLHCDT